MAGNAVGKTSKVRRNTRSCTGFDGVSPARDGDSTDVDQTTSLQGKILSVFSLTRPAAGGFASLFAFGPSSSFSTRWSGGFGSGGFGVDRIRTDSAIFGIRTESAVFDVESALFGDSSSSAEQRAESESATVTGVCDDDDDDETQDPTVASASDSTDESNRSNFDSDSNATQESFGGDDSVSATQRSAEYESDFESEVDDAQQPCDDSCVDSNPGQSVVDDSCGDSNPGQTEVENAGQTTATQTSTTNVTVRESANIGQSDQNSPDADQTATFASHRKQISLCSELTLVTSESDSVKSNYDSDSDSDDRRRVSVTERDSSESAGGPHQELTSETASAANDDAATEDANIRPAPADVAAASRKERKTSASRIPRFRNTKLRRRHYCREIDFDSDSDCGKRSRVNGSKLESKLPPIEFKLPSKLPPIRPKPQRPSDSMSEKKEDDQSAHAQKKHVTIPSDQVTDSNLRKRPYPTTPRPSSSSSSASSSSTLQTPSFTDDEVNDASVTSLISRFERASLSSRQPLSTTPAQTIPQLAAAKNPEHDALEFGASPFGYGSTPTYGAEGTGFETVASFPNFGVLSAVDVQRCEQMRKSRTEVALPLLSSDASGKFESRDKFESRSGLDEDGTTQHHNSSLRRIESPQTSEDDQWSPGNGMFFPAISLDEDTSSDDSSGRDAISAQRSELKDRELRRMESEITSLQEDFNAMRRQLMCQACTTRRADIVFSPCGHLCRCDECAIRTVQCPACDRLVCQKLHVNFAL